MTETREDLLRQLADLGVHFVNCHYSKAKLYRRLEQAKAGEVVRKGPKPKDQQILHSVFIYDLSFPEAKAIVQSARDANFAYQLLQQLYSGEPEPMPPVDRDPNQIYQLTAEAVPYLGKKNNKGEVLALVALGSSYQQIISAFKDPEQGKRAVESCLRKELIRVVP